MPKEENIFVTKFFSMNEDCDFPGCDELRAQYLQEKRKPVKGCAVCYRSSLVRKYKSIIINRLSAK